MVVLLVTNVCMQNMFGLICTVIGTGGCAIYVLGKICGFDVLRLSQFLMAVPLWRLFVSYTYFLHITNAFICGLTSIARFGVVLFIVYYIFCILAHFAFKDVIFDAEGAEFSSVVTFETIGDTFLIMFQVSRSLFGRHLAM